MSATGWRSHVHALVVDRERVLLVPSERGWALPSVELDGDAENDLRLAVRLLEELLGAHGSMAVLHYVDRTLHRDRRVLELVYVLACPALVPRPPNAEWADRERLGDLPLAEAGHRELVDRHLGEIEERSVPALRAAWAREGWLDDAREWIEVLLTEQGRPLTGRVEQLRVWCLSCLLRAPTAGGAVFFKATAALPLFVDEGRVMRGLSQLFPANVPSPLAVDSERRWMLLDDLGAEIGWSAPLEVRESVHRLFAELQVASTRHVEELIVIGCVDRRAGWLAMEAAQLIADDEALDGLEDAEAERLRSLEPRLRAMCEALVDGPVPDALVHGDLHLSNVAERSGRYVFFDWTDACVTHPFFDAIDIGHEDAKVRERLRDASLSAWREFASLDTLHALWTLAQPLASLNQAVSYRYIAANVERSAGREFEWALPYWLRKVLEAIELIPE